jgi:flagellar protein FliL
MNRVTGIKQVMLLALFGLLISPLSVWAEEAEPPAEVMYIEIRPALKTNFGFAQQQRLNHLQVQVSLMVRGQESVDLVEEHMPLVKDFLIEYFGFADPALITELAKRKELKQGALEGLNKVFQEKVGKPVFESFLIGDLVYLSSKRRF